MKKILIVFGLAIVLSIVSGFGSEKKHIDPADTIRYIDRGNIYEYEMVKEIDLGEDVYRVHFGRDSEYPRLVEFAGKEGQPPYLIFYDDNFNEINRIERAYFVFSSPEAEYVVLSLGIDTTTKTDKAKGRVGLFNKKGEQVWEKKYDVIGSDDPGRIYFVSDKGDVVEFAICKGVLNFYNQRGNEIRKIELFKKSYWDWSFEIRGRFSGNGDYFVINVSDPGKELCDKGAGIILFDKRGKELWRFPTEGNTLEGVCISYKGNYVIASTTTWGIKETGSYGMIKSTTYLLDKTGHLIRAYPRTCMSIYPWDFEFSPSEDYVIINDVKDLRVFLLEPRTGNILFKYSLLGKGIYFRGVQVAETEKLIGVTYDGGVELIHFNGTKLWSRDLPLFKDIPRITGPYLSDNANRISVRTGDKLLIFRRVK